MKIQVHSGRIGITTLMCLLCMLAAGVTPAEAQHHAVGSARVYPDAPEATQIHLQDDLLCFVEFAERCFGGMMAPDWLLCEFHPLPEHEWPEQCPIAVECVVTDSDGHHELDGSGMHGNMMRSEVALTIHYDPDEVDRMGIDPTNLCLAVRSGSGYEACPGAIHDRGAGTFTLSTFDPGGVYAVVPRASVPTLPTSWSKLKARHTD